MSSLGEGVAEGRRNVGWGFVALALFMAIGFVLGYMHDLAPDKADWIADYAAGTHFEIRLAHVHGSLFGVINVLIGWALLKLQMPRRQGLAISWLALGGLLMPIGILAHALFAVPPVLVLVGGLAMIIATVWTGWIAFKLPRP